jgi:hypothetical protein
MPVETVTLSFSISLSELLQFPLLTIIALMPHAHPSQFSEVSSSSDQAANYHILKRRGDFRWSFGLDDRIYYTLYIHTAQDYR